MGPEPSRLTLVAEMLIVEYFPSVFLTAAINIEDRRKMSEKEKGRVFLV
jgi:hypothetical protein